MPRMTPKASAAPKLPPPPAPAKRRARISRDDPPERRFPVIYRRLEKEYPEARTALNFSTPYEMLFATIMSAQSTDVTVNKVTEKLAMEYEFVAKDDEHSTGYLGDEDDFEVIGHVEI